MLKSGVTTSKAERIILPQEWNTNAIRIKELARKFRLTPSKSAEQWQFFKQIGLNLIQSYSISKDKTLTIKLKKLGRDDLKLFSCTVSYLKLKAIRIIGRLDKFTPDSDLETIQNKENLGAYGSDAIKECPRLKSTSNNTQKSKHGSSKGWGGNLQASFNNSKIHKSKNDKKVKRYCKGHGPDLNQQKQKLIREICEAIKYNKELRIISFTSFKFSEQHLETLRDVLPKSVNLSEFKIRNCQLTDYQIKVLSPGLCQCPSINLIDFSKNYLSTAAGMIMGKIISSQGQRKDEIIWSLGLRGEKPAEDLNVKGLCEVILSNNNLNDESMADMASFLKFDTWLRSLNISNNKVTKNGVIEIIKMLGQNSSLLSIDMRENEGFNRKASEIILERLRKNMMAFKTKFHLEDPAQLRKQRETSEGFDDEDYQNPEGLEEEYIDQYNTEYYQEKMRFDMNENKEIESQVSDTQTIQPLDYKMYDQEKQMKLQMKNKKTKKRTKKNTKGKRRNEEYNKSSFANGTAPDFGSPIALKDSIENESSQKQKRAGGNQKKKRSMNKKQRTRVGLTRCQNCRIMETELLKKESRIINLSIQNSQLRNALQPEDRNSCNHNNPLHKFHQFQ